MNPRHTPRPATLWLTAATVALLLAASIHLDGPSDIEAAQDVHADLLAAQAAAVAATSGRP